MCETCSYWARDFATWSSHHPRCPVLQELGRFLGFGDGPYTAKQVVQIEQCIDKATSQFEQVSRG